MVGRLKQLSAAEYFLIRYGKNHHTLHSGHIEAGW
jgi:hypothetical protein